MIGVKFQGIFSFMLYLLHDMTQRAPLQHLQHLLLVFFLTNISFFYNYQKLFNVGELVFKSFFWNKLYKFQSNTNFQIEENHLAYPKFDIKMLVP